MERLTYDFALGGNHCWQVKGADNLECREVCERQGDDGCKTCPIAKAFDRLAAIEDILGDEYDLDRLRELAQADRDGLVRIARRPPLESECCGNCGHFQRITGTARGDCAVREYTGKPWRGKFTPCQSRKACRQFQRRTDDDGRSDPEG